jgi:poly(A) polymerase
LNINELKNFKIIQLAYQLSQECGVPIYLVGGAVRDVLMGFFYGQDFDFTLGAQWDLVTRLFAEKIQGKIIPWDFNQKRVIALIGNRTITVDFSKFKGATIEHDLLSRDFTVNSMAVAVDKLFLEQNPEIIDPLNGTKHVAEKIIKANSPDVFDSDPLRILRAIRFAAAFNFSLDNKTKSLIKKKASLISLVAMERIKRELFAIFNLEKAAVAMRHLIQLRIMEQIIPELHQFSLTQQSRPHQYSLLNHSLKTVEHLASMLGNMKKHFPGHETFLSNYFNAYIEKGIITRRALLLYAALLHDSGKITAQTHDGRSIRFFGHELEGVAINQTIGRRMLLGKKTCRILETITRHHMRILHLAMQNRITERAIIRLLRDIKPAPLEVMFLALADTAATSADEKYNDTRIRVKQFVQQLFETYIASGCAAPATELVNGNDIMQCMGIPEGPEVGIILREIAECERKGLLNTRQEALQWLKKRSESNL